MILICGCFNMEQYSPDMSVLLHAVDLNVHSIPRVCTRFHSLIGYWKNVQKSRDKQQFDNHFITVERAVPSGDHHKKIMFGRLEEEQYQEFGVGSGYGWFEDLPELYEGEFL